ncbi:internal scaffolding protein [robinz microvirus RP_62]|nr:internal scaffolding protein [robinz microvirus RP_62]
MSNNRRSFYRPHKRVTFDNDLVDPVTGELSFPPSLTKQEFKDECDINNIIKQYSVTGMIRHVSAKAVMGTYEDLPDPLDFQESLAVVEHASASFMSLPAKLRDRFNNEPRDFLAFCSNPDNLAEMRSLGIANPASNGVEKRDIASQEPISAPTTTTGGDGGSPPSSGAKAP